MSARPASRPDTVLVTGASSGIGAALAERFAREGHALVLVARRAAHLAELAEALAQRHGVSALALPTDLACPGAVPALAETLRRRRVRIDVLVNNAGVLHQGAFTRMKPEQQRAMLDLNVTAFTELLVHLVPPMRRRGHGRVLNVASIAAFQPVPSLATYAATKAYVLSLSESLGQELAGSGVTVTALCPGITDTGMLEGARRTDARLARLPDLMVSDAQAVAEAGYQACMRGEPLRVPGVFNEALTLASRVTPRWLLRRAGSRLARRAR
jgi:short-subunit dehydrogenase